MLSSCRLKKLYKKKESDINVIQPNPIKNVISLETLSTKVFSDTIPTPIQYERNNRFNNIKNTITETKSTSELIENNEITNQNKECINIINEHKYENQNNTYQIEDNCQNLIFKKAKKLNSRMLSIIKESLSSIKSIKNSISVSEKRKKYPRKFKSDNIRKKIKAHFFKSLRKRFNSILKNLGSYKKLECIDQNFIVNTTKSFNSYYFEFNFEKLLTTCFNKDEVDYKREKNIKILSYIYKKFPNKSCLLYYILQKKMSTIFEEYIVSQDFVDNLEIIQRKDNLFYLKKYIYYALNFRSFISNC